MRCSGQQGPDGFFWVCARSLLPMSLSFGGGGANPRDERRVVYGRPFRREAHMTSEQLHCYTDEVWLHAVIALGEFQTMQETLADPDYRQHRGVWVWLQAFLSHTGMVSKLFSPPTKDPVSKARGEKLSKHLNVTDESPLLDRAARNAIEHLDERMDNWLRGSKTGFLECVFPNRAGLDFLDKSRWSVRRVLLLDEMVFVTEGKIDREETALTPLRDELERVVGECMARFKTDDPYSYVHPLRPGGYAEPGAAADSRGRTGSSVFIVTRGPCCR